MYMELCMFICVDDIRLARRVKIVFVIIYLRSSGTSEQDRGVPYPTDYVVQRAGCNHEAVRGWGLGAAIGNFQANRQSVITAETFSIWKRHESASHDMENKKPRRCPGSFLTVKPCRGGCWAQLSPIFNTCVER